MSVAIGMPEKTAPNSGCENSIYSKDEVITFDFIEYITRAHLSK